MPATWRSRQATKWTANGIAKSAPRARFTDEGDPLDWQKDGKCRTHPEPDLWFPERTTGFWVKQIKAAKDVCGGCPVLAECRAWSVRTREAAGIWGGWTERERDDFLHGRGRKGRAA